MRKGILLFFLLMLPLVTGARTPDEEYMICKEKCESEHAACMADAPKAESQAKTAEEKTCGMEINACYDDCAEARSLPGMIRRIILER